MRLVLPGAAVAGAVVVVFMALSAGTAGAAPTPTATASAPIAVIIPGSGSSGSGGGSGGDLPTIPDPGSGACVPGANPDGSPVPPKQSKADAADLRLDKARVLAAGWVVATATGFQPSEKAEVVLYDGAHVLGSYAVDASGAFSARFRIPEDTPTGVHVIEVTGWACGYVANAELTVVSPPSSSNWLTLWWVYIVLGVLLVGLLSMGIAFRSDIARWFGRGQAG